MRIRPAALALVLAGCSAPHYVADTVNRAKAACPSGEAWRACGKRLRTLYPDGSAQGADLGKTWSVAAAVCTDGEAWEPCFDKARLAAGQVKAPAPPAATATSTATFAQPYGE